MNPEENSFVYQGITQAGSGSGDFHNRNLKYIIVELAKIAKNGTTIAVHWTDMLGDFLWSALSTGYHPTQELYPPRPL